MSGTWARDADAVALHDWHNLSHAAKHLSYWLASPTGAKGWDNYLTHASAIIRRERRRLDPEGLWAGRHGDLAGEISDESLVWRALRYLAATDNTQSDRMKAWNLREVEAALRTMYKRGTS